MAEFVIKMADERGRVLRQVESAHSAAELRERFSMQGYLVYDVKPRGLLIAGAGPVRRRRLKLEQFVIFNSQFVTLVRAGLPILTALDLLSKQQRNEHFRGVLEEVRQRVKAGESLSGAFDAQKVASKLYTATLLAGEKSGNLEETIGRYIAFQRIAISFRKRLLASLVYPAVLVVAMVLLLSVLMLYVVPRFAQMYGEIGAELPGITQFMLGLSAGGQAYAPYILVAALAAAILLWQWRKTETGAAKLDAVRLRLPFFGGIYLKYQIAMFSRMLSTLLAAGLPMPTALQTASESMESPVLSQAVATARDRVLEGRPLARSIEETGAFPDLAIGMIEVGESTGALPQMLTSVAEFYEEDVQTALAAALSLIEPLILVIMGGVVAVVLISLYLPIFNLGAAAGGAR
jgi:type IV pilus assembly protein PilC